MFLKPLVGWLYWNPPRELFTLPLINRPVVFYGAFFVLGFILGYFILSSMLKKKLLLTKKIAERDISCWPSLIISLQGAIHKPHHPLAPILARLDSRVQEEISSLKIWQEAYPYQKQSILLAINQAMQSNERINRAALEELMPKAFITAKELGYLLTDKLTWFVVLGTIIGARLGHVLFYDWPLYQNNWIDMIKVWEGGLASHGGVLGVLFGGCLYHRLILKKFPEITFIGLLDCAVVPSTLVACLIRIGNFFNQELMGPPTILPWGVIFGNPADGGPLVPRHPTQLYEAGAYFLIFGLLCYLWQKKGSLLRPGILSGLTFSLIFGARILIDFVKSPQSMMIDESSFQMGQYLSLPFFLLGIVLFLFGPKLVFKKSDLKDERIEKFN